MMSQQHFDVQEDQLFIKINSSEIDMLVPHILNVYWNHTRVSHVHETKRMHFLLLIDE